MFFVCEFVFRELVRRFYRREILLEPSRAGRGPATSPTYTQFIRLPPLVNGSSFGMLSMWHSQRREARGRSRTQRPPPVTPTEPAPVRLAPALPPSVLSGPSVVTTSRPLQEMKKAIDSHVTQITELRERIRQLEIRALKKLRKAIHLSE